MESKNPEQWELVVTTAMSDTFVSTDRTRMKKIYREALTNCHSETLRKNMNREVSCITQLEGERHFPQIQNIDLTPVDGGL